MIAEPAPDEAPLAPGMLASHYAPKTPLRLNARDVRDGEALLAFGTNVPNAARVLNLSPAGDLVEAAANLFSHLRALDADGHETGVVISGLGTMYTWNVFSPRLGVTAKLSADVRTQIDLSDDAFVAVHLQKWLA